MTARPSVKKLNVSFDESVTLKNDKTLRRLVYSGAILYRLLMVLVDEPAEYEEIITHIEKQLKRVELENFKEYCLLSDDAEKEIRRWENSLKNKYMDEMINELKRYGIELIGNMGDIQYIGLSKNPDVVPGWLFKIWEGQ